MLAGSAEMATAGAGGNTTFADACLVPPAPVHDSVNVEAAVIAGDVSVPLTAFAPDQAPDAVQLVALVEDQVSWAVAPEFTVVGFALSVTVGAGLLPPPPPPPPQPASTASARKPRD